MAPLGYNAAMRSERRPFQFGLRKMFVGVFLAAVVFAACRKLEVIQVIALALIALPFGYIYSLVCYFQRKGRTGYNPNDARSSTYR